jgi:hypothetical protein
MAQIEQFQGLYENNDSQNSMSIGSCESWPRGWVVITLSLHCYVCVCNIYVCRFRSMVDDCLLFQHVRLHSCSSNATCMATITAGYELPVYFHK